MHTEGDGLGPRNCFFEFPGRFDPEVDGFIAIHHHFRAIKVRVPPLTAKLKLKELSCSLLAPR